MHQRTLVYRHGILLRKKCASLIDLSRSSIFVPPVFAASFYPPLAPGLLIAPHSFPLGIPSLLRGRQQLAYLGEAPPRNSENADNPTKSQPIRSKSRPEFP